MPFDQGNSLHKGTAFIAIQIHTPFYCLKGRCDVFQKLQINIFFLLLASHELPSLSFHLFSSSSYGHPFESIAVPSDQIEKVNHLTRNNMAW